MKRRQSRRGAGLSERLRTIGWDAKPSGCWEWRGDRNTKGYGRIRSATRHLHFAHRVAWLAAVGPVPADKNVLHHCDNPPCVNPAHLFLGSHQDNDQDRDRKGRTANGERIALHKLTDEQVSGLRIKYAAGARQSSLATEYGISQSHVSRIVHNVNRAVPTRPVLRRSA